MTPARSGKLTRSAVGAVLCVVAFFAYSFLTLSSPLLFNSPDENANFVFASEFADNDRLHRIEPAVLQLGPAVHPRSVKVVDDVQVPGGFLGLPLIFGAIGKVVGTINMTLLTPFFAVLGVIAWGFLLRRFYGNRVGLLGALILAAHPAWWYWSARTMMPNVPFMSLLIIAACLFFARPFNSLLKIKGVEGYHLLRNSDFALAGIFAGLALAVRPVELYWLVIFFLAVLVTVRRMPWKAAAVTAVFLLLTLLPFGLLNSSLYGGFLSTGYGEVAATVGDDAHQGMGARLLGPLRPVLFPLGFAPRTALSNFWSYGLRLFWGWTILVGFSALVLLRRRRAGGVAPLTLPGKVFLAAGCAVAVWLTAFYGSYVLQDNSVAGAVTIGVSYTRYWLPIFVLSTVPVALAADSLYARFADRSWTAPAAVAVFVVAALISGRTVFSADQEGLSAVRAALTDNYTKRQVVLEHTEPGAIVIADRSDKTIYPFRPVINPLRDERTYALLPDAVAFRPTYYFGITFPDGDLEYLRGVKLPPLGVTIDPVVTVGDETLYRFSAVEDGASPDSETGTEDQNDG